MILSSLIIKFKAEKMDDNKADIPFMIWILKIVKLTSLCLSLSDSK